MNTSTVFREISLIELLITFIIIKIISSIIYSLFCIDYSYDIIYPILFIIYFILKFRSNKLLFKIELNDSISKESIKEILYITILILLLSWGINTTYLYLGFKTYLAETGLSLTSPTAFIHPHPEHIPNFPTGFFYFETSNYITNALYILGPIILLTIGEELFFRGALHNKLTIHYGVFISIFLTSIIYILSGKGFGSLLPLFSLSIFLTIVYSKTKNIITTISISLLYSIISYASEIFKIYYLNEYPLFAFLIIILSIVSLILLVKYTLDNLESIKKFE